MIRLLIATAGMVVLTLIPTGFERLIRRDPADFAQLVSQLDELRLCPEDWQLQKGTFEFNDFWRERLGLHAYRTVVLTNPEGVQLTVLVMLSETGEQLFHTPAICYEAHGCDVRGDEVPMRLEPGVGGEARAVEVVFDRFADDTPRTAVFAYWVTPQWTAPPRSAVRSQLGSQPFLLKVQILVEDATPSDVETSDLIEEYFSFLGDQLRKIGI